LLGDRRDVVTGFSEKLDGPITDVLVKLETQAGVP